MNEKMFSNQCLFLKGKGKAKSNHEVLGLWQRSLRLRDVINFDVIGSLIRSNQNIFVANRYSSISCIKDKSIALCADITRLLLMFENLRLTLAKKLRVVVYYFDYFGKLLCFYAPRATLGGV